MGCNWDVMGYENYVPLKTLTVDGSLWTPIPCRFVVEEVEAEVNLSIGSVKMSSAACRYG